MKDKVFEKVTEYIDALASKLGIAAEHVYEVLIRQQITEGITGIITVLFVIIGGLFICKSLSRASKNRLEEAKGKWITDISDDLLKFLNYAVWVAYLISVVICVFMLQDSIGKLLNPEYYAIKEIFGAVGGK